jgi:hypothetical protein
MGGGRPWLHLILLNGTWGVDLEVKELSLAIDTADGTMLIVGCSHPIIGKIVEAAKTAIGANACSPVQCTGARKFTFHASCNAAATVLIWSSFAGSRCVPPMTRWIGLSVAYAAGRREAIRNSLRR